jgi:hypothetical protein
MLKEEGRALFCCPKWKWNFGTFLRFKNGLVFALPIKLNQISLFFADWLDNFLSYSIPVYTDLILRWVFITRNKKIEI